MKAKITYQGKIISQNIKIASGFVDNLCGFMFRSRPQDDYGIIFETSSIHTCFMRFDLDVIFLDRSDTVVKIIRAMPPWRFTKYYFRAKRVIELPGGLCPPELKVGDRLEVGHV